MTPYERAATLYGEHGGKFGPDVAYLLDNGIVVSTPTTFLMGYFCKQDEPYNATGLEDADCVFVVLCVGNPKHALLQLIELVKYVAFVREFRDDNRMRVLDIKKTYQLL